MDKIKRQIERLTPDEKLRALEILKSLEQTGYERYRAAVLSKHKAWLASGGDPATLNLRGIVERARRRNADPNHELTLPERLYNAADHQALLARREAEQAAQAKELAEEFRLRQETFRLAELEREAGPALSEVVTETLRRGEAGK